MDKTVAVVGLGYVGLPLALAFGRRMPTIGFDLSEEKIAAYSEGHDPAGEMSDEMFTRAGRLAVTNAPERIGEADFIVVAVPTPITPAHQPDLAPLEAAAVTVGRHLSRGAIVVFESTVYPGVTEEVCVPILERESGLKCGDGFRVGYSPERINPGDSEHTLETIVKVVSAQDEETLERVAWLYGQVIEAGVHRAPSIRVAEAAKVIENTQRDVNIALMNELALIFHKLGIDTQQVLAAARTKWNFLPFTPGLVGGHCIGVDPYYLTHRAEIEGFRPEIIKAARHINDGMGKWLADQTVDMMIRAGIAVKGAKVGVLGLTFKENCADLRNTRVIDCIRALEDLGVAVMVHDPLASREQAQREYGIDLLGWDEMRQMDAVVLAVGHEAFHAMDIAELAARCRKGAPLMDVKAILPPAEVLAAGFSLWRL